MRDPAIKDRRPWIKWVGATLLLFVPVLCFWIYVAWASSAPRAPEPHQCKDSVVLWCNYNDKIAKITCESDQVMTLTKDGPCIYVVCTCDTR